MMTFKLFRSWLYDSWPQYVIASAFRMIKLHFNAHSPSQKNIVVINVYFDVESKCRNEMFLAVTSSV